MLKNNRAVKLSILILLLFFSYILATRALGIEAVAGRSDAVNAINIPFGDSRLNYINIINDSFYNAFPGITMLDNGTLITVYRKGQFHSNKNPLDSGSIVKQTSADFGVTWSGESIVYNDPAKDSRDSTIAKLADGTLIISFFKSPATQSFIIKSIDNGQKWSSPINITSTLASFNATSAPVIELSNGKLMVAVYGKNTGDNYTSVNVLLSSDGGNTWGNEATVANGQTVSKNYAELNLVQLANGNILGLIRNETDNTIDGVTSTDSGITWSAVSRKFTGSGSPRVIQLSSGKLISAYRAVTAGSSNQIALRMSTNNGNTWTDDAYEYFIDTLATTYGMQYASLIEVSRGLIGVIYSMETTNQVVQNDADIRFRYITEGGGISPLGSFATKGLSSYDGDIVAINGGIYLKAKQQLQNRFVVQSANENTYLDLYNSSTTKKVHLDTSGNSYFSGGNVGVGTINPGALLHLGPATVPPIARLALNKQVALTSTTNNDALAYTLFVNEGNSNARTAFFVNDANSKSGISLDWSSVVQDFVFIFGGAEKMRITSGGRVGIGTTSPGYLLQIGNAGDGTEARANVWNTLSDEKLKTNITPLSKSLGLILALNGVSFDWKSNGKHSLGFIAQDVQKIIPDMVSTGADGYLSLDYDKFAPLLTEAIKELDQKINSLSEKEVKKQTLGSGVIKAGNKTVTILNPLVHTNSKILVTPTSDTGNQVLVVKSKVEGKKFIITITAPLLTDITFDWLILD